MPNHQTWDSELVGSEHTSRSPQLSFLIPHVIFGQAYRNGVIICQSHIRPRIPTAQETCTSNPAQVTKLSIRENRK